MVDLHPLTRTLAALEANRFTGVGIFEHAGVDAAVVAQQFNLFELCFECFIAGIAAVAIEVGPALTEVCRTVEWAIPLGAFGHRDAIEHFERGGGHLGLLVARITGMRLRIFDLTGQFGVGIGG